MSRFTADTVSRLAERNAEPAWLRERRLEALKVFEDLAWSLPTVEEWKHTDIRGLDLAAYDPEPPRSEPVAGLDDVPERIRGRAIGQRGDRLGLSIQVDADVIHRRLAGPLAEAGVVFDTIGAVAGAYEDAARAALGQGGVADSDAKIAALVHAFSTGGTFLYVPRGVHIELPIQSVRWLTRDGVAVAARTVIVADENSSVTYIDHYGSDDVDALMASTVEIYAHQAATVDYLAVQDLGQRVWHFNVQRAIVQRDANVRSLAAAIGGRTARSLVESILSGQGAHAEMLGVYFGDHDQHIDNRTLQLHRAPNTSSEVLYKGALKGSSSAVYTGLVDIEQDGVQTDASQANRNLLLSPQAKADASPFLEIKTSEVTRATHGVSVGKPDKEVLFYLASRGLDPAQAERLYVKGFFQEVIDRVPVPQIRQALEAAVEYELELED